jgi:hypothetical protein
MSFLGSVILASPFTDSLIDKKHLLVMDMSSQIGVEKTNLIASGLIDLDRVYLASIVIVLQLLDFEVCGSRFMLVMQEVEVV